MKVIITFLLSNDPSEKDYNMTDVRISQDHHTYSYDHPETKTLVHDMYFRRDAPRAGDPFPRFELTSTEGERFASDEIFGRGPALVITGSYTCPMTVSSNPMIKHLHSEYGEVVQFLMVHVREAHPGERLPQSHSFEEKLDYARRLKQRDELLFPVIVDDVDGTLHRQLDEKPNSAWLVDRDGRIAFRSLWAGDEKSLRQALDAVIRGERPHHEQSTSRLVPMAMGVGVMQEVMRQSGGEAQGDLVKAAPPMAAMAWLADQFHPLNAKWRGLAAMATVIGLTAAAALFLARRLSR